MGHDQPKILGRVGHNAFGPPSKWAVCSLVVAVYKSVKKRIYVAMMAFLTTRAGSSSMHVFKSSR